MESGDYVLAEGDFQRVRALLQRAAGISLSEAKRTLVVTRLSKVVRGTGAAGFSAYLDQLEAMRDPARIQDFVNALTTNLTRFYREEHHFSHLRTYIAGLLENRPRLGPDGRPRLRIWSAGCSTGQEPYTIALDLLNAFPELRRWDFRILATDIDTTVVARAAEGHYPVSELAGLSAERRALFEPGQDGTAKIPEAARSLVAFKLLNLMADFPMKGPFDAIFCRNVAIYFDRRTQDTLFAKLGALLVGDGFLYLGHSESLGSNPGVLRLVGNTVYQRSSAISRGAAA